MDFGVEAGLAVFSGWECDRDYNLARVDIQTTGIPV